MLTAHSHCSGSRKFKVLLSGWTFGYTHELFFPNSSNIPNSTRVNKKCASSNEEVLNYR